MNGWRLRLFVGVERLLARLGLKLPGKIMYIGGSDTLPPPLSRDEEAELIARLDGGDEGVKSQLIERGWWSTSPAALKIPAWALRI